MTLADAFADVRPVRDVPTDVLRQQLALFTQHKCWGAARFYAVRTEVQNRATWEWVKQDVFGHTFDGLQ